MCMHVQCLAGAGDYRVGVAGVVPPIAPTPELKDVKGICDVCRMPVFEHQTRSKNERGAYVHAHCVSAANLPQPYQQTVPDPAQPQHLQQHAELAPHRHALFRDVVSRAERQLSLRDVTATTAAGAATCTEPHDSRENAGLFEVSIDKRSQQIKLLKQVLSRCYLHKYHGIYFLCSACNVMQCYSSRSWI